MNTEYRRKICKEVSRYDMSWTAFLLKRHSWYIGSYLMTMRMVNYYENRKWAKIFVGVLRIINRHISRKMGFQINCKQIGFGIRIYHWGTIIINRNAKIGDNFGVYPGVCIGRTADGGTPTIGNNCTFFVNSGAYGGIHIGDNVTVAPNAVVTHDVPDNCIVAGIPAKILKYKDKK